MCVGVCWSGNIGHNSTKAFKCCRSCLSLHLSEISLAHILPRKGRQGLVVTSERCNIRPTGKTTKLTHIISHEQNQVNHPMRDSLRHMGEKM